MKKAQGLPLNTIIIAAIVLIVLVVLWAIFTGRMGKFTSDLRGKTEGQEDCATKGGGYWTNQGTCNEGETIYIAKDGKDHPGEICCRKLT